RTRATPSAPCSTACASSRPTPTATSTRRTASSSPAPSSWSGSRPARTRADRKERNAEMKPTRAALAGSLIALALFVAGCDDGSAPPTQAAAAPAAAEGAGVVERVDGVAIVHLTGNDQ